MNRFWSSKAIVAFITDSRTYLLLVVPFVAMFLIDQPTTKALMFSVLAVLAMLGVMLVARKIVLNYFDTREFLELARQGNVAAAVVIVGVLGFMSTILIGVVWWVRG
jgi:hypothetical protein